MLAAPRSIVARCYTSGAVTPLNAILGSHASAILILAVVGVALLAATAGMLDFMSGTSRVLSPLTFERERTLAFVVVGLPAAFVLLIAVGTLGAVQSGVMQTSEGTRVWLWLANTAFAVGVVVCGFCSPLTRHWGLGLMGFALGLGAIFPLLALISALGFNDAGLLTSTGDRVAFGVAVGMILLAVGLCSASLLAMVAYVVERMVLLLDSRHHVPLVATPAPTHEVPTSGRQQGGVS